VSDLGGAAPASYLRHDMVAPATFGLFVRNLPPSRGFLVAAGAESCCEWLEQFSFEPDDLAYLRSLSFDLSRHPPQDKSCTLRRLQ